MNINPKAKTIVCYGNSNTWGDIPNKSGRFPANMRWVGVLQDLLGSNYEVVNEGLNGRTFVAEDPNKPHRTGITHLKSILSTNKPIEVVVVMLGTNEMKSTFGLSAEDITDHLIQTISLIKQEARNIDNTESKILIICPPPVVNPEDRELDERLIDAPEKSSKLPLLFKQATQVLGCLFLDTSDFINLENTDGYHLDVKHHRILGEKVASVIKDF